MNDWCIEMNQVTYFGPAHKVAGIFSGSHIYFRNLSYPSSTYIRDKERSHLARGNPKCVLQCFVQFQKRVTGIDLYHDPESFSPVQYDFELINHDHLIFLSSNLYNLFQ